MNVSFLFEKVRFLFQRYMYVFMCVYLEKLFSYENTKTINKNNIWNSHIHKYTDVKFNYLLLKTSNTRLWFSSVIVIQIARPLARREWFCIHISHNCGSKQYE